MKIISWNLKNVGAGKLGNAMNPAVAAAGYGNNVGEFIVNVVMGNVLWGPWNPAVAADIFLIIELKCGGHNKSTAAVGTCTPCLTALVNAMNAVAGLGNLNFQYTAVPPLVCGYHECVGVIFNHRRLTYNGSFVLRDNNLHYINPRSPFLANFTVGLGPAQLNVVGIHAPPPSGGAAVRYRGPIGFCTKLPTVPTLMGIGAPQQFVIGGDFNSEQANTWNVLGYNRHPFFNLPSPPAPANMDLTNYATMLPAGTLTSVRNKLDNHQGGQARYLNGAYDNILFKTPMPPAGEYAIDLIGNMNAPPIGLLATLNNYLRVSDHMPVVVS